jgi:hypothetical protein
LANDWRWRCSTIDGSADCSGRLALRAASCVEVRDGATLMADVLLLAGRREREALVEAVKRPVSEAVSCGRDLAPDNEAVVVVVLEAAGCLDTEGADATDGARRLSSWRVCWLRRSMFSCARWRAGLAARLRSSVERTNGRG